MIKLIVTDLDGTLLASNHEVPERFWDIAGRLFNRNIMLAVATGRPNCSITEKFSSILHKLYAISDNGALVIHQEDELLCEQLPMQEVEALVTTSRTLSNAWPILCGKHTWFLENDHDVLVEKIAEYHKNITIVDDLTNVEEAVVKMSVCDLNGAENYSHPAFKHFEEKVKITVGGTIWLDITCTGVNKGEAVKLLQQLHNIKPEETLAFGDFMNDIEMLQAAQFSYAMKNAHPAVIQAATYTTEKDNNGGGMLDVIEKLCLGN